MGILAWLVLGLIAGAIAKLIMPGRSSFGWIATICLGIVGALVGGFLGGLLFNVGLGDLGDFRTWALAVLGSVICLVVYGMVTGRKA